MPRAVSSTSLDPALASGQSITPSRRYRGETPPDGEDPPGGEGTIDEQIADALREAEDYFERADLAYADGDFEEWGRLQELARERLSRAVELADDRDGGDGAPDGDATDAPTDEETTSE